MFIWNDFVSALKGTSVEFEHLKVIQMAQAILESGRGSSDLFKIHANPYGMKFRREMRAIADQVTFTDSAGETDIYCKFDDLEEAVKGYWVFIERSVYIGWRLNSSSPDDYIKFISNAGYIGGDQSAKDVYIQKVLKLIPEAKTLLGVNTAPATPSVARRTWKANGVLLEIGHGSSPQGFESGADGAGGLSEREYDLNGIAAREAQKVILAAGVPCIITDFGGISGNGLYDIGKTAAGYDVFCSIHHNSFNSSTQGAEVLVHNSKGDVADLALSKLMSAEIAAELGISDRIANGREPRQALGVLSGAEDTNVRVSVLAEVYFIDAPVANRTDWSQRGGRAIGRSILKWLVTNP
jgi:N-acetylmuramoyl-L-alanine amidase